MPEAKELYTAFTNKFYISSLPCGMGKTTALIETVMAILNLPEKIELEDGVVFEHSNISFIIFLSKLDEIASLASEWR